MKITHLPFNGNFKVTYTFGAYNPKLNLTSDKKHHGIDMVGLDSKDVYSVCTGKVIFAGWDNSGYGNLVKIQNGNTVYYLAHLQSISVVVNQEVTYTTKIGVMGATGNVTGPHTHVEIRENNTVINPSQYLGIPNELGQYNSNNYIINIPDNVEENLPSTGSYQVIADLGMNVRTGPGKNYNIKNINELSAEAKRIGGYKKGTNFIARQVYKSEDNETKYWARTDSGYVCIDPEFCKKI